MKGEKSSISSAHAGRTGRAAFTDTAFTDAAFTDAALKDRKADSPGHPSAGRFASQLLLFGPVAVGETLPLFKDQLKDQLKDQSKDQSKDRPSILQSHSTQSTTTKNTTTKNTTTKSTTTKNRTTRTKVSSSVSNRRLVRTPKIPEAFARDQHMQQAWQLSQALKAAKAGRKTGHDLAKLSRAQRRKVGTSICEHLLASLRAQVQTEQQQTEH
jgi:hypothetical protein